MMVDHNGCVFVCSVHPLSLAINPMGVWLAPLTFNTVSDVYELEDV